MASLNFIQKTLEGDGSASLEQEDKYLKELEEENGRLRELAANVVLNFKCIKQSWPLLAEHGLPMNSQTPVPSLDLRKRIMGVAADNDIEGNHFLSKGLSDLGVIKTIYETYAGRGKFEEACVLDWGVGCGRMIRHLPTSVHQKAFGADVDPKGINWCREKMGFGRYEILKPSTKMEILDDSFDLIYSHSVLTHLGEEEQFFWLQELNRVSRGVMILSVHGLYSAACIAGWAQIPNVLADWFKSGFKDSQIPNSDINDVVSEGYYRDVAHTPQYIYDNWSRYLHVVDIIPGGFGILHDAIICRPLRTP